MPRKKLDLVSLSEIAELLNVSRQRAHQLAERAGFPEPVAQLGTGTLKMKVWMRADVEAWARREGRLRG